MNTDDEFRNDTVAQHGTITGQPSAQYEAAKPHSTGRLEGTWADVSPLPYPSIFDRPVAPSKLDPVLLRAKMRGEAVYADERGLL